MRVVYTVLLICLVGAVVLLVVSPAFGQDITSEETDPLKLPSPEKALRYSLMYTLIPTATLVLAVPGLIVGPSTGFFYGGKPGRGWGGIGLRVAGIGGMISAFAICGWNCGPNDGAYDVAWMVFLGSGAIVVGSAVYDLATVKGAVRRENNRRLGSVITLSPEYAPKTGTVGMRLRIVF